MKRYRLVFIATALLLGILACHQRFLDRPVLPYPDGGAPRVEASCSQTIPSTAVVTLSWSFRGKLGERHRIDLTAYKDGFEQNRYATVWPIEDGQRPQSLQGSQLRKIPVDPALLPHVGSVSVDPYGSLTVSVEDLAGGVVYGFRLLALRGEGWVPGPGVRVQAPVCITERLRGPDVP